MAEASTAETPLSPLANAWIPPDLLARTQQVWGDHLGATISEAEALEILQTVHRMAGLAMRCLREQTAAETTSTMSQTRP